MPGKSYGQILSRRLGFLETRLYPANVPRKSKPRLSSVSQHIVSRLFLQCLNHRFTRLFIQIQVKHETNHNRLTTRRHLMILLNNQNFLGYLISLLITSCCMSHSGAVGSSDCVFMCVCVRVITTAPGYWVFVWVSLFFQCSWLKSWRDYQPESKMNKFNLYHKLIWLTRTRFITCSTQSGVGSSITFDTARQLLN